MIFTVIHGRCEAVGERWTIQSSRKRTFSWKVKVCFARVARSGEHSTQQRLGER